MVFFIKVVTLTLMVAVVTGSAAVCKRKVGKGKNWLQDAVCNVHFTNLMAKSNRLWKSNTADIPQGDVNNYSWMKTTQCTHLFSKKTTQDTTKRYQGQLMDILQRMTSYRLLLDQARWGMKKSSKHLGKPLKKLLRNVRSSTLALESYTLNITALCLASARKQASVLVPDDSTALCRDSASERQVQCTLPEYVRNDRDAQSHAETIWLLSKQLGNFLDQLSSRSPRKRKRERRQCEKVSSSRKAD